MACRKNAYRGMVEASEWNQKQQEERNTILAKEEDEQRKFWTPILVFDACCTQWLKHGREVYGHTNNRALIQGCSGGCGKDHPRITLDYNKNEGAFAQLTHNLDPFVRYFDSLVSENLARRKNYNNNGNINDEERCYYLTGYLSTIKEKLERPTNFGSHLIKVSPSALAASRRAHERYTEQEELEQEFKRRKISIQCPVVDNDLLVSVLDVCHQHNCFRDHLDLVEIAWMRVSNKIFAKYAAKIASSRIRQLRLSYSVLVEGGIEEKDDHRRDVEDQGRNCYAVSQYGSRSLHTVISSRLPLKALENHVFVPDDETNEFEFSVDENSSSRQLIRVYLEGGANTNLKSCLPEKDCLYSDLLEVARFYFNPYDIDREGIYTSSNFKYNVTSLTQTDESKTGKFCIQSFQFDFRDFLGIYVRKKLPKAKENMQEIKKKRPITTKEKEYVKAIAKAARESPGNSQAFQGMKGW